MREDASSLATGVVIENCGSIAEDTSWLQLVGKDSHINLAEFNYVFKEHQPGAAMEGNCDSPVDSLGFLTTYLGRKEVHTKAASEMLIRCWLITFWELASE